MEAVAYVFNRENLPPFPRFLELLIQDVDGKTLTRKEFAARLSVAGFKTTDQSVSQWINEERTPPPGLPYYTALALNLEDDVRRDLSWSFTSHYRDKRRTVKKKPETPSLTEENVSKKKAMIRDWDKGDGVQRDRKENSTNAPDRL